MRRQSFFAHVLALPVDDVTRVSVEARGPLLGDSPVSTSSAQTWLVPGATQSLDLQLHGLIVTVLAPAPHGTVPASSSVAVRASVENLCGCGIDPSLPWKPDLYTVTALVRDLAAREIHRRYLALAHGDVGTEPFTVDAPVGRDPAVRVRMAVTPQGKPARTDVYPVACLGGISAVRCQLHTGRTHQIRVHLASRGHPLVADGVYGGKPALGMQRQALHAVELELAHPVDRRPMAFRAEPPSDFAAAWSAVASR